MCDLLQYGATGEQWDQFAGADFESLTEAIDTATPRGEGLQRILLRTAWRQYVNIKRKGHR
ncbi:hypothetical protein XBKB1_1790030 [Xenorhabdus bovienii str. kraussei Becker Underwood]|uniref:Uncharacterized protein n=1 Tax=Xenorhabdus bovienii str. kraussei Becker Underwood TaxID=1398204 RepID=A0A077PQT7_XENBV|nr:hypothetical protein XBKB1_1790030 [Xenorhabdus bovienii str. kraussei Becker Underwood]